MFEFWILIIAPLATWRITSIIYKEKVAQPIRSLFGVKHGTFGEIESYPATWYGYLIGCTLCLSVWIGTFSVIMVYVFPYVLLPFAVSALSIWIEDLNVCLT